MTKKGQQREFQEVYHMIEEANEHQSQLSQRVAKLRQLRGDLSMGINDLETAINSTLSGNPGLMTPVGVNVRR